MFIGSMSSKLLVEYACTFWSLRLYDFFQFCLSVREKSNWGRGIEFLLHDLDRIWYLVVSTLTQHVNYANVYFTSQETTQNIIFRSNLLSNKSLWWWFTTCLFQLPAFVWKSQTNGRLFAAAFGQSRFVSKCAEVGSLKSPVGCFHGFPQPMFPNYPRSLGIVTCRLPSNKTPQTLPCLHPPPPPA